MKISIQWLQDFLDLPEAPREVGERLTLAGLAVDGVARAGSDTILELDVTANRGDCLSHIGVARELSAIYDIDIRAPEAAVAEESAAIDDVFAIAIDDAGLCRRYCGRYISGVRVGPSPEWLVRRLEAVGIRSINNVADATNYALMELGHPLHAFDADTLEGSRVIVRRAAPGETLRTIDGDERRLDETTLVIADARRPVALAGIMGGVDTEISDGTTNVLLESAWFDPVSVRKTGKRIRLGTEASYRFERGADVAMAPTALERAAGLIIELAGGVARRGVIDVYPAPIEPDRILLRRRRIAEHLGAAVPGAEVDRVFRRLGFEPRTSADGWTVRVPSHRHDVAREEDLIEEIARHHGYDRFPATLPGWSGQGRRLPSHAGEAHLRDTLAGLGYSETCSIAFGNRDTQAAFAPDMDPVEIRNPLSEDAPILRTSLVPSVIGSIQWNLNRGLRDLALYEISKIYPTSGEVRRLVMAATGAADAPTVHGSPIETDVYRLKGEVEGLLSRFDVDLAESTDALPPYLHPGRSVRLGAVASVGELHAEWQSRFKLRQKTCVAEIDVEQVLQRGLRAIATAPIPKYPAVRRDLSLLVARETPYRKVVEAVHRAGVDELTDVFPFDRLDRGPFSASFYSLAVTLVFQSGERTLTDSEVQGFAERVLAELRKIGIQLRS